MIQFEFWYSGPKLNTASYISESRSGLLCLRVFLQRHSIPFDADGMRSLLFAVLLLLHSLALRLFVSVKFLLRRSPAFGRFLIDVRLGTNDVIPRRRHRNAGARHPTHFTWPQSLRGSRYPLTMGKINSDFRTLCFTSYLALGVLKNQ